MSECATIKECPELVELYRSCPPSNPDHWQRCHICSAPLRWDLTACTSPNRHPLPNRGPVLYASRTGTRRNLAALAENNWRLLATPHQKYGEPIPPWAFGLDNGAWTSHQTGDPFDDDAFMRSIDSLSSMADWVVIPDVVCGGLDSLEFSKSWMPRLNGCCRLLLLPVQDGMEPQHVEPFLSESVGIFIGGSTDWKEQTMTQWAALARKNRSYCHVGRVNTQRRLAMVVEAGADSCDGTTATLFSVNAAPIAHAAKQTALFAPGENL